MTQQAADFDDKTPRVTLGGKDWPVPDLAPRQLREIREPILDLTRYLEQMDLEAPNADGKGATGGQRYVHMNSAQYSALTDIVYVGLTRAHPDLTRDAFLDMAINDSQMFSAFLVVRGQSGLFKKADPDEAPPAPPEGANQGEAIAAP